MKQPFLSIAIPFALSLVALTWSCSSRDYAYTIEVSRDGSCFVALDSLTAYRCGLTKPWACSELKTGLSMYGGSLALSGDGSRALIGEGKGFKPESAIVLWDLKTGKEIRRYSGHRGPVSALAFNAKEDSFYSAGEDGRLYRWALDSGKRETLYVQDGGGLNDIALSPDGDALFTGTVRKVIGLDLASGKERILVCPDMDPQTMACSPDGKLVAVGGRYAPTSTTSRFDRRDYLWIVDAKSLARIWSYPKIEGTVYHVRFSPDGARLYAMAHRWDEGKGRYYYFVVKMDIPSGGIATAECPGGDTLHRIDFDRKTFALDAAGGRALYQGAATGIALWNLESGRVENRFDPWRVPAKKR